MNKKVLVLFLSGMLLGACHKAGNTVPANTAAASSDATPPAVTAPAVAANETKDVGSTGLPEDAVREVQNIGTSFTGLSPEEAVAVQKEFLKILSVKDEALTSLIDMGENLKNVAPGQQNQQAILDKMYQASVANEKKLTSLSIQNPELKKYVDEQKKVADLAKKVYDARESLNQQQKSGQLSKENQDLLKNLQIEQAKSLQEEIVLTARLAQVGPDSPQKELLQLKTVQSKELLNGLSTMQIAAKANASDADKQKQLVEASRKVAKDSEKELNALSIKTPDINAYRAKLANLSQYKLKMLDKLPQWEKAVKNAQAKGEKQLPKEIQQQAQEAQSSFTNAEKLRIQLTRKYAQ